MLFWDAAPDSFALLPDFFFDFDLGLFFLDLDDLLEVADGGRSNLSSWSYSLSIDLLFCGWSDGICPAYSISTVDFNCYYKHSYY